MITKSQGRPGKSDPTPRPAPKGNWSEPLGFVTPLGGNWSDPLGRNWSCPLGSSHIGGLGYHPDLPDHRDCGWKQLGDFLKETTAAKNERVKGLLERVEDKAPDKFNLGDDTTHPLPPIENQGRTNSCTANAAVGLVEYLYRWATGSYNDFSRLFVYYNARKLLGCTEDKGAYIRSTFQAMRLFGVPPETERPFDPERLNSEPNPYNYSYASNFKTMTYARLDAYGDPPEAVQERLKQILYTGFPVEFGFPVYSCIQNLKDFVIPVPTQMDQLLGGHAVLAVG